MLANPIYWALTAALVLVAVLATVWVVAVVPSRRHARSELTEARSKAAAEHLRHRSELRQLPIRWEQERRRAEHADWTRRVGELVDPMIARWLEANPGFSEIPQHELDRLFSAAEQLVGPEPHR